MGKNYSFTVAVFLYCDSVSDCFYEEESEISDCIMKQAGTWMGSGLFLFLQRGRAKQHLSVGSVPGAK